MTFKKNKIKKTSPIIINTIGVISLLLIFLLGLFLIKNINFLNFDIDSSNISNTPINNNPNTSIQSIDLKKQNTFLIKEKNNKLKQYIEKKNNENKINILIVGRGGGSHDAPNLTDTIILASINTKTKIISMLSIPRDLYVEYPSKYKVLTDTGFIFKQEKGKLNGIYATYSFKNNSKKIGMDMLKSKISQITGEKIDYFVNVDFKGFIKIIDTIGGINITIPKQFVDNRYPDGNWGYKTLIFKKGTWLFDGENTLKYARSRHSTSDFDRAIRQQQVIKAIKDKLSGSYFLTSPGKIKELYDVFKKYVYTDIKLPTLVKLIYTLKSSSDYKIISSNINDSCFYGSDTCSKGGFLYTPQRSFFGGMSVLLVNGTDKDNLNNYSKIQIYIDIIFNYPKIFEENYKVNVFNSLKINNLASLLTNDLLKYGFNIPKYNSIGNTKKIYNKSVIYYNNINENSETIQVLKKLTNAKFIKIENPKYSKDNANIEIIIGEDYLSDKNPLNF